MATHLILGTAGHIDHGKTSLIRALTGVDTDRLPEEKRRGITIDLGFAELAIGDYRLGIVDAPGHERFVKNMLAGASGYDLALLVVAADDSIKPQTREHLAILRLLGLKYGAIALTKRDLVDDDWLALVIDEIRELVADSFLADSPIVPVSATTGAGLDALRDALHEAAERASAPETSIGAGKALPFRMPIDRAFTVAGHGAVATGSVASGVLRVGDELVVEPGGAVVRVRGLHHHDRPVEEVSRGQRAAINLAGIRHDELHRGQVLASPGSLVASRWLTVRFSLLPTAPRPLKNRDRVKVHLGAVETNASVRLLGAHRLAPGDEALGQLLLQEPAAAIWRQPLVLRTPSPAHTIGGAVVLDPEAQPLRRPDEATIAQVAQLESPDAAHRIAAAAWLAGLSGWSEASLSRRIGAADIASMERKLKQDATLIEIQLSPTRMLGLHQHSLATVGAKIEGRLSKLHDRYPLQAAFDRSQVIGKLSWIGPEVVLAAAIGELRRAGKLRGDGERIGLADRGPRLSKNEERLLETLVERYRQVGLKSPSIAEITAELAAEQAKNRGAVRQLLDLAVGQGRLVKIDENYLLHAEAENVARAKLESAMAGERGLLVAEIREVLDVSRKYAVPLCEHFDRVGFTKRVGDRRVLANSAGGKLS